MPVPLVSILIPCYNAERWIGQAIESALVQTWPNKEVIVVDDGSTDGSLKIIKRFNGRIKWETGPNRGGNPARNRLLELSNGEWLQYLDADDYLLPNKIEDQVKFLTDNAEVDIVFGRVVQESLKDGALKQDVGLEPPTLDPWALLVLWELPQTGACLYRKESVLAVGGWKLDQPCCQEHELYMRLLTKGSRFSYCPSVGAVYRQWPGDSVSRKNVFEVLQKRLEIVRQTERHLRETDRVNLERSSAINQARFEIARSAWTHNRSFALSVARETKHSDRTFEPGSVGSRISYSWPYRMAYRLLGFERSEQIASFLRKGRQVR